MDKANSDPAHLLGPEGPIARKLPNYELRECQIEMARLVQRAIEEERCAVIEAGTGTGKSLAYLIPIILAGKKLIVSTANKALQAQLYEKDVPFLKEALGLKFSSVLVKGRNNYICLRKWEEESRQQDLFAEIDGRAHPQLAALEEWLSKTETGDIEELPFLLSDNLLPYITSSSEDCLGRECRFFSDECFIGAMRKRAGKAQVVITNHHLLMSDLALREVGSAVLPQSEVIVIDEAHHIEDIATAVFEITVSDYTVERLLSQRLVQRNISPNRLDEVRAHNRSLFLMVSELSDEPSFRLEGNLEEGLQLSRMLNRLASELAESNPYRDDPDSEEFLSYALAVNKVMAAAANVRAVFSSQGDDQWVRYVERVRKRFVRLVVHAAPISAAPELERHLFDGSRPVICTSATLATPSPEGGGFEHFKARCGLSPHPGPPPMEGGDVLEWIGPPVFNYREQALLYLPNLPTYDWEEKERYFSAIAGEIERLLEVSRGRAFCLFTSWDGLEQVYHTLSARLPWPLFKQGQAPRRELLERFKNTPHSVLFGTRSFWEGVDVPGEALSLVIIDKLPFPSPKDPLHQARMEKLEEEGHNSFTEYMLPLMTLALKQGFGRLIRNRDDRGVVAILDNRLVTRHYGSWVLRSLPPARPSQDFADVSRFFASGEADYALNFFGWLAQEERKDAFCSWKLVRLKDGRIRSSGPLEVEGDEEGAHLRGLECGLEELRRILEESGRSPGDFGLEVRGEESIVNGLQEGQISRPKLAGLLGGFRSVRYLGLKKSVI